MVHNIKSMQQQMYIKPEAEILANLDNIKYCANQQ